MSITLNTVQYDLDSYVSPNKVTYVSSANTFTEKDSLSLGRIAPKPTSTSRGVARSEFKGVHTVDLDDSTQADVIIKTEITAPVGMAEADLTEYLDRHGDFLVSAGATSLGYNHDINQ
jgi:hypothetical protein